MATLTGENALLNVLRQGGKQVRVAERAIASRVTSDVAISALVSCGVTLLCGYTLLSASRCGLTGRSKSGHPGSRRATTTNGAINGLVNGHSTSHDKAADGYGMSNGSGDRHNDAHRGTNGNFASHTVGHELSVRQAERADNREHAHHEHDAQTVSTTYQKSGSAAYEGDVHARQYMEFQFTPSRVSFVHRMRVINEAYDFPLRLAQKFHSYLHHTPTLVSAAADASAGHRRENGTHRLRGLDLGCATGVSVFEMSKLFDGGVIGVDKSATFIQIANEARQHGLNHTPITFKAPVQGELFEVREEAPLEGAVFDRCEFYEADCMHILPVESGARVMNVAHGASDGDVPAHYWRAAPGETFDGILCINLIDRVPQPSRLLDILAQLLHKGGILVMADPYSWSTAMTEVEEWIGGKNGVRSEDALKEALTARQFQLLAESDEAFLMRNHVRHYQLGFSHCTIWRKM